MKTESNILATGGWPDMKKNSCPSNPKGKTNHFFTDSSSKPGKHKGEYLVTSRCKYCGALVVDCPTIYAF